MTTQLRSLHALRAFEAAARPGAFNKAANKAAEELNLSAATPAKPNGYYLIVAKHSEQTPNINAVADWLCEQVSEFTPE